MASQDLVACRRGVEVGARCEGEARRDVAYNGKVRTPERSGTGMFWAFRVLEDI